MQHNYWLKILSMIIGGLSLATVKIEGSCKETIVNDIAKGAQIWANNCARCHNARPATEFSNETWQTIMMHMRLQAGLTGQEAKDVLEFLVPGYSTSPDPTPSPDAKKDPATATHQVKNEEAKEATKASKNSTSTDPGKTLKLASADKQTASKLSGKDIFHQTCVACHGENGKGAVPGTPDMTKPGGPLSQSNATLMKHIKEGFQKPGDPMAMPPKGGNANLTDEDIKNVLDYIEKTFKH